MLVPEAREVPGQDIDQACGGAVCRGDEVGDGAFVPLADVRILITEKQTENMKYLVKNPAALSQAFKALF